MGNKLIGQQFAVEILNPIVHRAKVMLRGVCKGRLQDDLFPCAALNSLKNHHGPQAGITPKDEKPGEPQAMLVSCSGIS